MKRPSFQFYPGDWLRDTALRSCSVEARGLWIEMICLMHEGSPYGWLKVGDKVIHPDNLARIVGSTLQNVEGWLKELEHAKVFSKSDDGVIISRRMIRDEEIRQARAAGGVMGGNPSLLSSKSSHRKVGDKVILQPNLQPTPSSSSSSSPASAISGDISTEMALGDGPTEPPKADPAADIYVLYPRKVGRADAIKAIRLALKSKTVEFLTERTKAYADAVAVWSEADRQFVPHPATWFNRGSFDDDPETWKRPASQASATPKMSWA